MEIEIDNVISIMMSRELIDHMHELNEIRQTMSKEEQDQNEAAISGIKNEEVFRFFLRWKKIAPDTRNHVKRLQKKENAWARGISRTEKPDDPEHNAEAKQRTKELRRINKWASENQNARANALITYRAEGLTDEQQTERETVRQEALATERAAAGPVPRQKTRYLRGTDPAHDELMKEKAKEKNRARAKITWHWVITFAYIFSNIHCHTIKLE